MTISVVLVDDHTMLRQSLRRAIEAEGVEVVGEAGDGEEAVRVVLATKPDVLAQLKKLAEQAHTPAVEGTFSRTDRHERDRRAKLGQHDNPNAPDPLKGAKPKPKANGENAAERKASAMPTKASRFWKTCCRSLRSNRSSVWALM